MEGVLNLYAVHSWVPAKRSGRDTGEMFEFLVHAKDEERAREKIRAHLPSGQIRLCMPHFGDTKLVRRWKTED